MNAQTFIAKWRGVDLKERSFYQEHFLDLCALIDHPTPAAADPTGERFTFEAGAGRGFADVWKKGFFAWEYKGKRGDLDGAYDQLLRYRESLQNPPLLIAADAHLIPIHTNFTNTVKREYEIELADLADPDKLALLRHAFFEPQRLRAPETPEQVTEQAAKEFAHLAEILRKWGEDPAHTAHFLIRLLFCLFAEDIGLLPRDLFTRLVARTRRNSQAFAEQLRVLFRAMSTGGWFGEHEILHFNGGLFESDFALEMDSDGIDILAAISGLDWSSIEPSILGTLFERSLDPGKRAQLGAHYTSRDDILLIVEPVLMTPLRRRWMEVEGQARDLAAQRDAATGPRQRQNRTNDLARLLDDFAAEIRAVRVLDPACGSGNFLYVALRQLLELWRAVSNLGSELGLPLMLPTSAPSPAQLYGIELNEYAHELAQATIWIGYIQWLRENGFGQPPVPILKQLDNIHQMDAILAYDESGNPVEPDWPAADIAIGNPPFLGDKKMRGEMGDRYVEDLRGLYAGRVPGGADLVCYWFEKARALVQDMKLDRAGLLATNSIRGGANRVVLDRINDTGSIFWAISDREWVLDGAAVNISMIGFDNGRTTDKLLDGSSVGTINSDLTHWADITKAIRLKENYGIAFIGDSKKAKFEIPNEIAQEMLAAPVNPNNRPNSEVIRPWLNGIDVTRRPQNMWIIDFGIDMPEEEACLYEIPYEYIRIHVKPEKEKVRSVMEKKRWWLHARPAPDMREAIKTVHRFIATSNVSKHRLFVWFSNDYLPSHSLTVFARDDDYFFGLIHSKIHEVWALHQGTSLENRPRYTPTTTFETFPFPWPPGEEPTAKELRSSEERSSYEKVTAIAAAAQELNEKRQRWLNPYTAQVTGTSSEPGSPVPVTLTPEQQKELKKRTLTNLYNQRPTWLDLAHQKLDQAVFTAYGWPADLTDDEILERLLALNLARAAKQAK